jgi:hypothetical protein
MLLQVEPEPDPREREAIEQAVEELLEDRFTAPGAAPYRSAWRLAGLRESVEDAGAR